MSRNIILYFPTNYRHGNLGETCYQEEVSVDNNISLTSDDVNEIFKKTRLYKILDFLSYKLYIQWNPIININNEVNVFIAIPKIKIFYRDKCLKYFFVPTYNNVKFDFYLLTNTKNNIIGNEDLVITDKILSGNYIVSL